MTFLGHMNDSLWSVDLFGCESVLLTTHWVLVVVDQFTRRLIGFGVRAGEVDGIALCRMFNRAISGKGEPRYLSSDHDPLFEYHRWKANLRILAIEEIKTRPYAPLSQPFVERLIGTLRREYLDHVLVWNALDLERKLAEFQVDFYRFRVHSSLVGDTPAKVSRNSLPARAELHNFRWQTHGRGLYQLPRDYQFATHRNNVKECKPIGFSGGTPVSDRI